MFPANDIDRTASYPDVPSIIMITNLQTHHENENVRSKIIHSLNPAGQPHTLAATHSTEDHLLSLRVTQMSASCGSLLLPQKMRGSYNYTFKMFFFNDYTSLILSQRQFALHSSHSARLEQTMNL